jgi:hypothetical protein
MLAAHHAELPKAGRWRRKKKTARSGGDRAVSLSCVSLGDAKGELRVSPEMARA